MSWTTDQISILINAYKKYPCLYVVRDKNYHNKNLRNAALQKVVHELSHVKVNVTEAEVQKKFMGLRTTYANERRKVLSSTHSGMEEEALYKPTLWYYTKLEFLNEHLQIRASKASFDAASGSSRSEESQDGDEQSELIGDYVIGDDQLLSPVSEVETNTYVGTPSTSTEIKRKGAEPLRTKTKKAKTTNEEDRQLQEVTKQLGVVVNTMANTGVSSAPRGTEEVFGEFVATQLKLLTTAHLQADVCFKIHGLLHAAQMEQDCLHKD